MRPQWRWLCGAVVFGLALSGCGGGTHKAPILRRTSSPPPAAIAVRPRSGRRHLVYRVPPLLDPHDVYAADRRGDLAAVARRFRPLVSCEFAATMIVVDVPSQRLVRTLRLRPGASPQDVKLAPDGRVFYVADLTFGGVWEVDASSFRRVGFGPHGLCVYPQPGRYSLGHTGVMR